MEDEEKFDSELFALEKLLSKVETNNELLNSNKQCKSNPSEQNTKLNSSDDIEHFFDTKCTEYGFNCNKTMDMKYRTASQNVSSTVLNKKLQNDFSSTKSFIQKDQNSSITDVSFKKQTNNFQDKTFGFRIINPLISSNQILERMSICKHVTFSHIAAYLHKGDQLSDWFISGVLVNKTPVRLTKNGTAFSVWRLSDLGSDSKTVLLYMFNGAHKEFWKTAVGMCIAILNPNVLEKRLEKGVVGCLSIDTGNKILLLGQSKDFGICKARTRMGEPCSIVVNLQDCEYCLYHVKQNYEKYFHKSKVKLGTQGQHKNLYGSQSFPSVSKKTTNKCFNEDIKKNIFSSEPQTGQLHKMNLENKSIIKKDSKDSKHQENITDQYVNKPIFTNLNSTSTKFDNRNFSNSLPNAITNRQNAIRLNLKKAIYLKEVAAQIVKKCPIKKLDPNSIRGSNEGKHRLNEELESKTKRQKLHVNNEKEKMLKLERIVNEKSSHTNLINLREDHEQEKYFEKLETKESLEEKMLQIFKVATKAFICKECKYAAFSPAEHCKVAKHTIKVVEAEKRFFQCKDCGYRTVTLYKIPKLSCNKCMGSRWMRAPMISERKICHNSELLSIRGDEEKFVGNYSNPANINLLVPDQ